MKKQLSILELIQKVEEDEILKTLPYRNGLGQLLPWEEPEYLLSLIDKEVENEN